MEYRFEWDARKAATNAAKHGVSFEQAAMVFRGPSHLSLYDMEHSEKEDCWFRLGLASAGVLSVVNHTFKQPDTETVVIRLISARKATKREHQQYTE